MVGGGGHNRFNIVKRRRKNKESDIKFGNKTCTSETEVREEQVHDGLIRKILCHEGRFSSGYHLLFSYIKTRTKGPRKVRLEFLRVTGIVRIEEK